MNTKLEFEKYMKAAMEIYQAGQERVKTTPAPTEQKFIAGSFVRIAEDLGPCKRHFEKGCYAMVQYTYKHAYGGGDEGIKQYALLVRQTKVDPGSEYSLKWYTIAWYDEHELTPITDYTTVKTLADELYRLGLNRNAQVLNERI